MLATIVSNRDIILSQISAWEEEAIHDHFSASAPRSRYIVDTTRQSWDGVFRRYNRRTKRLARPYLAELRSICDTKGYVIDVLDERPESTVEFLPESQITNDMLAGITLRDFQINAIKTVLSAEVGIFDIGTGGGKCLGRDTQIRMFDGTLKAVQDIIVGDQLLGDDSTPRTVKSVISGFGDLYMVDQNRGISYVVNGDHILSLRRTNRSKTDKLGGEIVDISVYDYLNLSKKQKHILKGYKVPVTFVPQAVPFDPYLLGLWLGDGTSTDLQISVNEFDNEIVEYLDKLCSDNGMVLVKYPDDREQADIYAIRMYEGVNKPDHIPFFTKNEFKQKFKELGLFGNKHVPDVFLRNSRSVRLKVLAGFIDADGNCNIRGDKFDICHRRGQLIDGIEFIARSLGFGVSANDCIKSCTTTGRSDVYRRIIISGYLDEIPTILHRKRAKKSNSRKNQLNTGITVSPIGSGQYFGFEIDGNKRFLLSDCTVTHNTEVMAGICKVISCNTVIVTEMTVIVDQIKQRLMLRDVCEEPGLFYSGKRPNGETITIGCIQSLSTPKKPVPPDRANCQSDKSYQAALKAYPKKLKSYQTRLANKKYLDEVVGKCDMILVDEADTATSDTWKDLFRYRFKGRYRYGFTGTPYDDDKPVEKLILQEHLGSVIFQHDKHAVQADGLTVPLTYTMIVFGDWENRKESSAYDIAVDDNIVYNERFHDLIAKLCLKYDNDGKLILVERDDLGHALIDTLAVHNTRAEFYHGKTPKSSRPIIRSDFESRKLKVLIGGKNIRRGLDLKGGCEILILASGGKLVSELDQRLGRARRINSRGISHVFDFLFVNNKYLYEHSRQRLRAVVKMGYKTKVVFKDCVVDGEDFIRSRFRKPKQTSIQKTTNSNQTR